MTKLGTEQKNEVHSKFFTGPFDLLSEVSLDEGGFGKVFHVKHAIDEKEYAIKTISLDDALFEGNFDKLYAYFAKIVSRHNHRQTSIYREVRILQRLDYPNILRYNSCWLTGPEVSNGKLPPDCSLEVQNYLVIQTELCH